MPESAVRAAGAIAATAALVALFAGGGGDAAGSSAAKSPCAAKPSKGKPHASAVSATALLAGMPVSVDMRKVPKARPVRTRGTPHEVPQPSLQRARKLKKASPCVPHARPTASAPTKP
jgi:hypothetical protein